MAAEAGAWRRRVMTVIPLVVLVACASTASTNQAVIADAARTDQDREDDAHRKPLQFLAFAEVEEGMQALDIAAGGGYTTELLSLSVGSSGHVYAQVPRPSKSLAERLKAHPAANVTVVVRDFDDPIPDESPLMDVITIILSYHDIAATRTDRVRMDRKLFEALRPGGHLIIIDHAARAGTGTRDCATLHRIDEATVKSELAQAGFHLEAESDFLREPDDPRTQPFFDMATQSDKFALRYTKD